MYGNSKESTEKLRNPQLWLPPRTVLDRLADVIMLQIDYLLTVGKEDAVLPNFLAKGCLEKRDNGEIEYNFGPDSHVSIPLAYSERKKRTIDVVTTPRKICRKRRPLMASTPKKMRVIPLKKTCNRTILTNYILTLFLFR